MAICSAAEAENAPSAVTAPIALRENSVSAAFVSSPTGFVRPVTTSVDRPQPAGTAVYAPRRSVESPSARKVSPVRHARRTLSADRFRVLAPRRRASRSRQTTVIVIVRAAQRARWRAAAVHRIPATCARHTRGASPTTRLDLAARTGMSSAVVSACPGAKISPKQCATARRAPARAAISHARLPTVAMDSSATRTRRFA